MKGQPCLSGSESIGESDSIVLRSEDHRQGLLRLVVPLT
jgi:hypothetical protein